MKCFREKRSTEALEIAKRRVEEEYLLVGTTEKLGAFIETLEVLLPHQFHGISHQYKISGELRSKSLLFFEVSLEEKSK